MPYKGYLTCSLVLKWQIQKKEVKKRKRLPKNNLK